MGADVIQIKAEEDGCVYFFDHGIKKWRKVCIINSAKDLPPSVKRKMTETQEEAKVTLSIPLE